MQPLPHLLPKVDVLVLYSEWAWTGYADYSDEQQLVSAISAAFVSSNEAMVNSDVDMEFNIVKVEQVSAGVEHAGQHGR